MKLWPAFALALLLSATLLYGQTPAPAPSSTTLSSPGRYQLVVVGTSGNSEVWMIDTQTGDTWRRQGTRWNYTGNPTQDPGPKAPPPPAAKPQPPKILPELPTPASPAK